MNSEEKILLMLEGLGAKIDKLEAKVDKLEAKVDNGFKELADRIDKLEERQGKLEERQGKLEERQGRLEEDVAFIRQTVTRIEVEHGEKLRALFDSYSVLFDISSELRGDIVKIKAEQQHHEFILKWITSREPYDLRPYFKEKAK